MKKLLSALALLTAFAGNAFCATMTFDNFATAVSADFLTKTYSENGITATGNGYLADALLRGADSLYIADGGWGGPTRMVFTMAGLFDAISFDLTPSIFNYFVTNTLTGVTERSSFLNVRVEGIGATGLKAVTSFNMGDVLAAKTYVLGAAFTNLTSLVFGFEPTAGFGVPVQVGANSVGRCTDTPCSRYRLDNVTLAPVPLPAALSLMLTALVCMAGIARHRRRAICATA